jgi:ABC-type Na+ transport system ATPase subunit NatA
MAASQAAEGSRAGKTTLVRTMATLLNPDTGHVRINGFDAVTQPVAVRRLTAGSVGCR